MKTYVCTNCGKNFRQKGHYDAHCARKNPCQRAGVEGDVVLALKREIDELRETSVSKSEIDELREELRETKRALQLLVKKQSKSLLNANK